MLGPFGNAIVTDNAIAGRRGPLDRRLERVFNLVPLLWTGVSTY